MGSSSASQVRISPKLAYLIRVIILIQSHLFWFLVRSDFGTENVAVCDFMLHARSAVTNPFITGRSVHNQRIERLWLDVFLRCVLPFHTAFQ